MDNRITPLIIICFTTILLLFTYKLRFPKSPPRLYRYKKIIQSRVTHKNNRKPDWVRNKVIELKALMPTAGCRKIADTFNRLCINQNMQVSKSYVANVIRDNSYLIAITRKKIKSRVAPISKANLIWGIDLTFKNVREPFDNTRKLAPIFGIIDHGTRKIIRLKTITNKTSWTLLGHLCLAIGEYGKPKRVRTDNEACFNSRCFNTFLKIIKIKHQCIEKRAPWQNGRIERLFGTLKENLNQLAVANSDTLQKLLGEFVVWYNQIRPHQHLHGHTPDEIWHGTNAFEKPIKSAHYFSAWEDLLTGFYIRR